MNKRIKWTYEKCEELAKTCKDRKEFKEKYSGAFYKSSEMHWIGDWFKSLKTQKPSGYWTYERCLEESKKYKSYSEFHSKNLSAYFKSFNKKWIFDFTWLFDDRGVYDLETKHYVVYKYHWEKTNTVYIGLTKNLKERDISHRKIKYKNNKLYISSVKKYADDNNLLIPKPIILSENLNLIESKIKENYWVEYYKNNNFNVINISKTGEKSSSIGGSIKKWTFENAYEEAKKYSSRSELQKNAYGCYRAIKQNGWFEKMDWLKPKIHPNGYWTYERCLEHAKKYKNLKDYCKNDFKSYRRARDNKWLEIIKNNCYD